MHTMNKQGQSSTNYGGGHTGKGKKGVSSRRTIKSVYAAGTHNVLKKTAKNGKGYHGPRVRKSCIMNPRWFGIE